jgi:hypothetical protein
MFGLFSSIGPEYIASNPVLDRKRVAGADSRCILGRILPSLRVFGFALIALIGCRTLQPDTCQLFTERLLGPPVDTTEVESPGSRGFVGFVLDNQTGLSIPNAELLVYEGGRPTYAVADEYGVFRMHNLVLGTHSIAVRRPGFVTLRSTVRISNTTTASAIFRLARQITGPCAGGP